MRRKSTETMAGFLPLDEEGRANGDAASRERVQKFNQEFMRLVILPGGSDGLPHRGSTEKIMDEFGLTPEERRKWWQEVEAMTKRQNEANEPARKKEQARRADQEAAAAQVATEHEQAGGEVMSDEEMAERTREAIAALEEQKPRPEGPMPGSAAPVVLFSKEESARIAEELAKQEPKKKESGWFGRLRKKIGL